MEPCPAEDHILSFVEDRLQPLERAGVEAHLAGCDSCGALVAAVTRGWFSEGRLPSSAPRPPQLAAGQRLGPYEILSLAGRGAMGEVYRARDTRLGRDVALKTLPERFAADPERLARFQREARASGGLSHPATVTLFDVGAEQGVPYLVSEWLAGETLRTRLATGPFRPEAVCRIGAQLTRGLAAAHARNIVHRDLSPGNVFLCADGTAKILDFGLARLAPIESGDDGDTTPGALLGTAGYMAPEQIQGERVDARADLFALGALLHEMCSGRPAFPGSSPVERMAATLRDDPERLPGELGAAISRCMARAPEARFQSAQDLAFHLEALAARGSGQVREEPERGAAKPPAGRPGWMLVAVAALLAAAASATVSLGVLHRLRPVAPAAEQPRYHALTFGRGPVLSARLSRDGQTVVYGASWEGGLPTLYTTRLERPGQSSLGVSGTPVSVSAKGELAMLTEHRFKDSDFGGGTLARMSLSGGAPRALVEDVVDADWNPDGETLIHVRHVGRRFRIERSGGQVLFESSGRISRARVQPGGTGIAFAFHPNPKDDGGKVMLLDGQGPPRELTGRWESLRGLAWAPGPTGWEVWFTAATSGGDYALYAARRAGPELLDRIPGRMVLEDVSADGRALVDRQSVRNGLWVGSPGGAERDLTWYEFSVATDLSADGRKVLFVEAAAPEGPEYGAYVRDIDGGPAVRLGNGLPLALSPDGEWALVGRGGPPATVNLVPTGAGTSRPLPLGSITVVESARFFPDGRHVLLRAHAEGRPARMWVAALDGSPPRPITAEGVAPLAVPSPDGQRLAGIDDEGALRVWSSDGSELAIVPGRFEDRTVLRWAADGRGVLVRDQSMPVQISHVSLDSGRVRAEFTVPSTRGRAGVVAVLTLFVSADGRSYAYTDSERLSRLYLVEGLAAARHEAAGR
jgi:hypothetical protein